MWSVAAPERNNTAVWTHSNSIKRIFFFFLINRIHLSVIKPFYTVQVLKTSVNVFVQWQNVKTIVIARQTKTQCITKEWIHPSGWHNKEISAILLLQDEVNHLLYRWERAKRGRHENSIKTSRSWLSNSKRRSSCFHSRWMLMGKQAESGKGARLSRKQFQIICKHENSETLHLDECLAVNMGGVIDMQYNINASSDTRDAFPFMRGLAPATQTLKRDNFFFVTIPNYWVNVIHWAFPNEELLQSISMATADLDERKTSDSDWSWQDKQHRPWMAFWFY